MSSGKTTTKRALETLENSATEKPNCDRKYEIVFGNKRLYVFVNSVGQ